MNNQVYEIPKQGEKEQQPSVIFPSRGKVFIDTEKGGKFYPSILFPPR